MTAVSPGPAILLVDDHAVVREGLRLILDRAGDNWSVSEAGSGFQAIEKLRHETASLVIVDLSMPGMGGLELIRRIRAEFGRLPVLVLSMHAEEQYAIRAFKAGASGYLTKDSASAELVGAVRKLTAGGAYISQALAERVVLQLNGSAAAAPHAQLSDRELDVLRRLAAGERPTDIAAALHLSVKTVSTHKTRILDKLALSSLADLVRYAIEHGLHSDDADNPPDAHG